MKQTISVVVPFYKRERFFDDCLNSILVQTRKPNEIIVVDDGSGVDSINYLKKYSSYVKIVALQSNTGVANARNTGVKNASGDLIAFQDSDDIWEPKKLEYLCEFLERHSEYDATFSGLTAFYPNGTNKPLGLNLSPITVERALKATLFSPQTLVIRRQIFQELGGYDSSFPASEDRDFGIRFVAAGYRAHFIPMRLVRLRRGMHEHLENHWATMFKNTMRVTLKHRQIHYALGGKKHLYRQIAMNFCHYGKMKKGLFGYLTYLLGRVMGYMIGNKDIYG